MHRTVITIQGIEIPFVTARVVVVGSGAAALNAAVHLKRRGVDDLLIVTAGLAEGTSALAGSDKQTYYRLNPGSPGGDRILDMAQTLFAGGCMHGDIALVEAALSSEGFSHLVHLGVPFVHDRYGLYPGYKTDHDPRARGTSAGPRTSIMMHACLCEEVNHLGIPILDRHAVVRLLPREDERERRIAGLVAMGVGSTGDPAFGIVGIAADFVVYGTGGPAALYADSVYPYAQTGALGIALKAGVQAQNLTESQFGIAALYPRWNLSGSYQQVLPRYISTDRNGTDEREFLNTAFPSAEALLTAQFLKGYQWPFDVRRINDGGSSSIDLLVLYETTVKRRRVFLDFTCNPEYPGYEFAVEKLPTIVQEYLERSQALAPTPVARLKAMNTPAYELFRTHGVDLARDRLEIAMANQHLNGGLTGSIWWESTLCNLFAVGECNGTHGIYRPGGCALNAGQVGSFRAAECIAWRTAHEPVTAHSDAQSNVVAGIEAMLTMLHTIRKRPHYADPHAVRTRIQKRMSRTLGIVRNLASIIQAIAENEDMQVQHAAAGIHDPGDLLLHLQNEDLLITERAFLESAKVLIARLSQPVAAESVETWRAAPLAQDGHGHPCRGSFVVGELAAIIREGEGSVHIAACHPDGSLNDRILEVWYESPGEIQTRWADVRPIPVLDDWFETVWSEHLHGVFFREDS